MSNVGNNSVNNVSASGEESRLELYVNLEWKDVEVNGKEKLIPDSWKVENIGETIDFKLGSTPPKTGNHYNGDIPWVTISNISGPITTSWTAKIDYEKARVLPKGSLIGSFKMTVGRFSILGMDASTNEAIVGVPPDGAPGFSFDYLRFALVEPFVSGASTNGQGVQLLNTKTIKSLCFVSPSFDEQTLIAQALSTQEAQVADLRKLAAIERQRLTWLSDELLSGRLRVVEDPTAEPVVVSRDENGEPVEVLPGVRLVENREWKSVEVNGKNVDIPTGWDVFPLGKAFNFINGSAFKPSDWNKEGKGIRIVRIQNLTNPSAEYNYTERSLESLVTIEPGDLLMSWSGTLEVFKWSGPKSALNQHIFRVDIRSKVNISFAEIILRRSMEYLRAQAHGATMVHVRKGAVEDAQFLLPLSKEQSLIAAVLAAQEKQAADIERLADLEQKRLEWLSDELLSGRLRIKVPA